jgi:hypothetical protein
MAAAIPWIAAAISAAGAVQQGQAQAASATYNAQVAEKNSQIAKAQGAAAAEMQSRDAQRRMGAAIASFGASGVDVGVGSPTDVLAESVRNSTLDALTLKYNYDLKAMGFSDQANLNTMSASNAKTSSYFDAAGSIAKGYGQTYGSSVPSFGAPSVQ